MTKRSIGGFEISTLYSFNKQRQLDGTIDLGPKHGSYCITTARVAAGWGLLPKRYWPASAKGVWPLLEPRGLDRVARYNRTFTHIRIRDLHDARVSLAAGHLFSFSCGITEQWRKAASGVIITPKNIGDLTGQHAIAAVGYNDSTQSLTFMNSWGPDWGNNGYGHLPYGYFERFLTDAWAVCRTPARRVVPSRENGASFCLRLEVFRGPLGHQNVVLDVWDMINDVRAAWAFMTFRDEYLDVEDFFVRPEYAGSEHQDRLTEVMFEFANSQDVPIRLFIAHSDVRSRASNFQVINRLIRDGHFKVRKSQFGWAAYVAV